MSNPYRPDPSPPNTPPRFSPLRPFRVLAGWCTEAAWWLLASEPFCDGPKVELSWFAILGFWTAILCECGAIFHAIVYSTIGTALWPINICATFFLIRTFLRVAMHLDEPESRAWWESRFR